MNNNRFKFRVWNKKKQKYTGNNASYSIDESGLLHVHIFGQQYELGNTEDFVVEQCTGLKDKSGKLIYEGDLVKIPDDWDEYGWLAGEIREIYYKDGGFRFKPKETTINRGERGHWLEDDGVYEIIGNIHEQKDKQ